MSPNPSARAARRPGAVLAIIVASYLMIVIDISIVITGLPKIRESLGFSPAALSWVQNAYTLAFGGLLLLGARAGDIFGRRRMFIAGLALFTLASLAIGLAPSPAWLLAARAVQGAGAAVLAPSTLALLSTNFEPGPARTRALAYYAAAAGVGATAGLVLGGLFADLVSWRAGFFINLPIGVALIVAARRCIPETPTAPSRLDVAGALSSTLGMGALVYGIVRAAEDGWTDRTTVASLAVGLVFLVGFVVNEMRAAQPLLPLRLFADRQRSGAYAARMLFLGGMVGFWFFTTQYLQSVLGYRPLVAGLAFLPTTLPNFAAALMVPRLTRRLGNAGLVAAGLVLGVMGLAWLGHASVGTLYWTGIALPMVLIGIGQGFVLAPLTAAAMVDVSRDDTGAASGMVNVAHQLGGSLGLAVLVVVFAAAEPAGLVGPVMLAHRVSAAIDTSALMLLAALCIVLATFLRSKQYTAPVVGTFVGMLAFALAFAAIAETAHAADDAKARTAPLMLQDQGSFAVGGTVIQNPQGQTLHGDHARVFYQVPANARKRPLVMWHGFGQFGKTWETTADGREGFQTLFLRRRFPVYLVDQPRRGGAARSTVAASVSATPDDQRWFDMFRLGRWPEFFPGVQFSRDPEALNQYFRQMVPDTGPFDAKVATDAVSAVFDRIGPGVLVTHSHSGGLGWTVAMKNPKVRAVVAYEPGSGFVFPEGEVPPPMPSATGPLEGVAVPIAQFRALTRIPIVVYYGDNIPTEPSKNFGEDNWRVRLAMARLWTEAINRHGGDATLVHLPEIGIRGNTHFPFSDLNNVQIADLMSAFLARKGLD